MEARIQTLIKHGDELFNKRSSLLSLLQEIADNFYPERADFTASRNLGTDFAANLTTSYPILARRDLGNSFSAMLRPSGQDWFDIGLAREDREDNEAKRWLEWASGLQRRAMYDRATQFVRATKEGDHDFAAFGQCVLSVELDAKANTLLYRCWHLRDVAWCEGYNGKISNVHRKWKPSAINLNTIFRGNVSSEVKTAIDKEPYREIAVCHAVIPSENYESPVGKKWKTPLVSVFFEEATGHILEEVGTHNPIYIIPRWQTVSGSQYAYSPATVAALPDARLIQSMTLTLLEAGEKAVNPPMITPGDVLRSDIQLFAGGVTAYDAEYDERSGEVLRPIPLDFRGLPHGMEMRQDIKQMIGEAFFLSKISMPPVGGPDMTAYEVGQRIQEYIRNALPLFEPMEMDYNGALCDQTFDILLRAGAFGSPEDMPKSLRGQEIQFRFESPLHEAIGKQKGQQFQSARALLAEAAALDPAAAAMVDARVALRDSLDGIGVPAKWIRSEEQMAEIDVQQKQQQEAQQMVSMIQQGGAAAEQVGKAGVALNTMQQGAA